MDDVARVPTFRLNRPYPVFRVRVDGQRLVTDACWWRTALMGEEFVRVIDLPFTSGPMARAIIALRSYPLYLEWEGKQLPCCSGGDPMLCVAVDQLQGAGIYDAILLDATEVCVTCEERVEA